MNTQLFNFKTMLWATALALAITSCGNNEGEPGDELTFTNGVIVANEGQFGSGTGTLAFWSRDNARKETNIFETVNQVPLGNVVQSTTVWQGRTYVVVNNANKVEVLKGSSLKPEATINNLQLPRYVLGVSPTKVYVTEWVGFTSPGRISVINTTTNQITKTIALGNLPEKMLLLNDKVYVVNSNNNTVAVINTTTDEVESNISVGDWPNSIAADADGNIWVLCGGVQSFAGTPTSGKLVKFNPATPTAQTVLDFGTTTSNPNRMVINGAKNMLYYLYGGGIYSHATSSNALSPSPVINRSFYSLGIDPTTNQLYGADAKDFASTGMVVKYNTNYTAVDSFATGITPTDFCFVE